MSSETLAAAASPAPQSRSIERRLQRIEASLDRLSQSMTKFLEPLESSPADAPMNLGSQNSQAVNVKLKRRLRKQSIETGPLAIGQFHSFGAVDRASQDLQSLKSQVGAAGAQDYSNATNSLQHLSKSLTTVTLGSEGSREGQDGDGYFIPSKIQGYSLMSREV